MAEEDEQDEKMPKGCSSKHKRRQRGSTMMVKSGRDGHEWRMEVAAWLG
jgi:hypothetical protein